MISILILLFVVGSYEEEKELAGPKLKDRSENLMTCTENVIDYIIN